MTDTVHDPSGELAEAAAESQRADAEARQRRGTRQLFMARALFMVFSYVSSIILARELEPEGFGVYGILLASLVWLEMVSYAGVPAAVGKLIADHQNEAAKVGQSARFILFVSSLVLFAAGWVLAPVVAKLFHLADGARLFRIAILDLPLAAAYQGYSGILMGERRFGPLSVSQAVLGAAKLLGVLALLVVGISVANALMANVLATGAAFAYLLVRYPPTGYRPAKRFIRRLVSLGIPMGAFAISLQVLISLDLWFLGGLWHGSEAVVGQYVAALKIAQTLIVIPIVQSGVLLASVAWALASGDREGARRHVLEASRFALILTVPACVIVGGTASALMSLIYSSRYAAGGTFLALQLVAFSCFALMDSFAHALMAAGRQRIVALVLTSFIPVVAISNLLLIPRLGPMGAAVSLLIGMAGVTVVTGALAWRQFGPPLSLGTLVRVAAAAAVVAVPTMTIPFSGPLVLIEIVVLGAVYLIVLGLLGEIGMDDFALPRVEKDNPATT